MKKDANIEASNCGKCKSHNVKKYTAPLNHLEITKVEKNNIKTENLNVEAKYEIQTKDKSTNTKVSKLDKLSTNNMEVKDHKNIYQMKQEF